MNRDVFTDHLLVYCEIVTDKNLNKQKFITFRDFRNFSSENFESELSLIDLQNILKISDIDKKNRLF